MNADFGLGSSNPGPDITIVLGSNQATHISSILTAFTSSDMALSTGYEPFCLSLSHTCHTHTSAEQNNVCLPSCIRHWVRLWLFFGSRGRLSWASVWVSLSSSFCHGAGQDPVFSFVSISRLDPWNSFSVSLAVA